MGDHTVQLELWSRGSVFLIVIGRNEESSLLLATSPSIQALWSYDMQRSFPLFYVSMQDNTVEILKQQMLPSYILSSLLHALYLSGNETPESALISNEW